MLSEYHNFRDYFSNFFNTARSTYYSYNKKRRIIQCACVQDEKRTGRRVVPVERTWWHSLADHTHSLCSEMALVAQTPVLNANLTKSSTGPRLRTQMSWLL